MFQDVSDDVLLLRSFANSGELFFFLGFEATRAVDERIRQIRAGEVPLVRELPGCPDAAVEFDADTPPAPPPPSPSRSPVLSAPAPTSEAPHARPKLVLPIGHKPVLVFDTETTALSPPIACQLAYVLVENGAVTREVDNILKLPPGVRVQQGAFAIHGISTERCAREGVDAPAALKAFCELAQAVLLQGGSVVGHNVSFDRRAIEATRKAHEVIDMGNDQPLQKNDTFCTMRSSASKSTLKDKAGRRKAMKNEELYLELYGSPPTWARLHDALADVHVTLLNYASGAVRGWW